MDTTATVMYVGELEGGERYAVLGHVGDCRAYFVYPTGEVVPLTEDEDWLNTHEALTEVFKGVPPSQISAQRAAIRRELDDATSVEELSPAALGLYAKRNQTRGVASIDMKPHMTAVRFPVGCRIVFMSDGVYENIRPGRIGGVLSMNSTLSPEQQSAALVREAQEGVRTKPTLTTKMDDKTVLIIEST
jgi:serine/threonine protein phosphatase PrpC